MRPLFLFTVLVTVLACGDDPFGGHGHEIQGIRQETLDLVYSRAREIPGSFSLLVQRNGVLVAEEYFHGFAPDSLHDVRSVTKSVVSILVGLAVEEGFISSIDDPVGPYLRPVVDSLTEEVAAIPIRYFLMMSSGLDWHELDKGSSYSDWWQSDDMIQFVVDLPVVHAPGERFIYNTGASHLLSVVLTQATGTPTLDFAMEHLFGPLGETHVSWLTENRGYHTGGMGLRITARTMMKVGQMFLDGGTYQGLRVLPQQWVEQSTLPQISTSDAVPYGGAYGFLWWVGSGGGRDFYFANGYGGQFILVDPDLELVVVAQNDWRGKGWDEAGAQWYQVLNLIVEVLLPAVQ
jgi:CubicO group peptidase (beta-lactamase class C family)